MFTVDCLIQLSEPSSEWPNRRPLGRRVA